MNHIPTKAKTDAGNGSYSIRRVSNILRSPSPDPKRSPNQPSPVRPRYITLAVVLVVIGYTFPIIPCGLPPDIWPESEAERVKAAIYEVVPHLNKLYLEQAKKDEKEAIPFYNVVAKFGVNNMRRTILGSWRFGTSSDHTYAFGVYGLLNMPHTKADHKQEIAQVTPETLDAFLEWAKTASIDSATGLYADSVVTSTGGQKQ